MKARASAEKRSNISRNLLFHLRKRRKFVQSAETFQKCKQRSSAPCMLEMKRLCWKYFPQSLFSFSRATCAPSPLYTDPCIPLARADKMFSNSEYDIFDLPVRFDQVFIDVSTDGDRNIDRPMHITEDDDRHMLPPHIFP